MLRMEDRIRRLCSELVAKSGDEEVVPILAELREALHQYIDRLRERFGAYPLLIERRARNDIHPLSKQEQKDTATQSRPTDAA
jgi:hypothetical protein